MRGTAVTLELVSFKLSFSGKATKLIVILENITETFFWKSTFLKYVVIQWNNRQYICCTCLYNCVYLCLYNCIFNIKTCHSLINQLHTATPVRQFIPKQNRSEPSKYYILTLWGSYYDKDYKMLPQSQILLICNNMNTYKC